MTKLRTPMRCDVILAILLAEHRAPPRRGEGVQGAFPGASCVNIRARFSPLEQRWTKTACACDKHNGADAAANARPELAPCGKPLAIACGVVPDAFYGRPQEHLGPRVPQPGREASRGREASVRGPSYFFLTIMPALPEEMLLAVIANWYVVDAVGGVKPSSVPGSYLTDTM